MNDKAKVLQASNKLINFLKTKNVDTDESISMHELNFAYMTFEFSTDKIHTGGLQIG